MRDQVKRHLRHGKGWKHSWNWKERARRRSERQARHRNVGNNSRYFYSLGINFVMLSGRVVRELVSAGFKNREWVWFRIAVPNQDRDRMWLFLPVRTGGALAYYCYANIQKGDIVTVVGRIFSGRIPIEWDPERKRMQYRQFVYLIAEKVSPSHPVLIDKDSRYVRVRVDLFRRMCALTEDLKPFQIPPDVEKNLDQATAEEIPGYDEAEFEVESDLPRTDPTNVNEEEEFEIHEDDDQSGDSGGDGGGDPPVPEQPEE